MDKFTSKPSCCKFLFLVYFRSENFFSGNVPGEPPMTSFLRLNDNNSGKCGSTVVSVQSTDGFSITVLKQSPCIWITLGKMSEFNTEDKHDRPNNPDF